MVAILSHSCPPKADIAERQLDVGFVPQTNILRRSKIVPFVDHLVEAQPAALAKGHYIFDTLTSVLTELAMKQFSWAA
jgi:hypothetical protein